MMGRVTCHIHRASVRGRKIFFFFFFFFLIKVESKKVPCQLTD